MNISKALATPGFMSEVELTYIAELASRHRLIVEVGTWRGRSAVAWAENTEGVVFCVDPFDGAAYGFPGWWTPDDNDRQLFSNPDWLFSEFKRNTNGMKNIFPQRKTSVEGARIFKAVGIMPHVIFLDADHSYESITQDINAWLPLLAEGGVMCGHDYGYPDYPGVKQAVDEHFPDARIIETIWTTEV
jgi:hypothetical protein